MLAEKFDIIVVGRDHRSDKWYTLPELTELLATSAGRAILERLLIRIYGPEDFLTLWRYRFAKWLGFSWIPGPACPFPLEAHKDIRNGHELLAWMKEHGVTQAQLAEKIGVSERTLRRNLNGKTTNRQGFWDLVNRTTQVTKNRSTGQLK